MKAALLIRVSDKKQMTGGNSIEAQLERLEKYCREKDLVWVEKFSFDETAYHRNRRRNFREIVSWLTAQSEKVILVVDKVDRLARDFSTELLQLIDLVEEGHVEIHFPNDWLIYAKESPAIIKMQVRRAVVDAYGYSASSHDNVKRTMDHLKAQGRWLSKAMTGYRWKRWFAEDGKTEMKTLECHPDEAPYVIEAFRRRAYERASDVEIVAFLNHHGVSITDSNIAQLLSNPFYCGFRQLNGQLIPHPYPKLISYELFEKAQRAKRFTVRGNQYTFQGIIRCGECNYAVASYVKKGNTYLRCPRCNINAREDKLLGQVLDLIDFSLTDDQIAIIVDRYNAERKFADKQQRQRLEKLYKDRTQSERDIEGLVQMRARGEVDSEIFQKNLTTFKNRYTLIQEKIKQEEKSMPEAHGAITIEQLVRYLASARARLLGCDVEDRREFLRLVTHTAVLWPNRFEYVPKVCREQFELAPIRSTIGELSNSLSNLVYEFEKACLPHGKRAFSVAQNSGGNYGRLDKAASSHPGA